MTPQPTPRVIAWCRAVLMAVACAVNAPVLAQDAARGAGLYLKLPQGLPSCVGCHGPDPTQNRNRLLFAADRPEALLRALNTVGVMGNLRTTLSDADVADLAAYLGRVLVVSSEQALVGLYPAAVEFGTLAVGQVSPEHRVSLINRTSTALAIGEPRLQGIDARLRHNCPSSLPAEGRCEAWVQFTASKAGAVGGALAVGVAGLGAPLLVGLSAEGRAGQVGVLSADVTGELRFGEVTAGTPSALAVRLRSSGDLPVTLGVTALTGPDRARFAVDGNCIDGLVLPPGSSCTVGVDFRPAVAGQSSAALQWRSDGVNPGNLLLSGSATASGAAPPPAPPPAPPATPPATSVPPAPTIPTPAPLGDGGGGGGCSVAAPLGGGALPPTRPVDPLWMLMLALATWRLCRRRPAERRLS